MVPSSSRTPINRILRSSIVDGPGNRAVVFTQGCNFNCVYCHNPETINLCVNCGACVAVCPAGALQAAPDENAPRWDADRCERCDACLKACPHSSSPRVRMMTAREVFAEIEKALPFIRGVTVSGGECTLHPAFLCDLAALVHARNLTFFIDTNGSYDFSANPLLLDCADAVMPDIKGISSADGAAIGTEKAIANAAFLAQKGKLYEVRTVVSPGLFDAPALVEKVCATLSICAAQPFQYRLTRYRPFGVRAGTIAKLAEPDDHIMEELASICAKYGVPSVTV